MGITRREFIKYSGIGGATAIFGSEIRIPKVLASSEPIRIGQANTLDFPHGKSAIRGAEIAIEEINEKGGILGRRVEYITADDKGNVTETAKAVRKLVENDKINFLLGGWRSEIALSLLTWGEKYNLIILTVGGSTAALTLKIHDNYEKYKTVFRAGPTNQDFIGQTGLTFVKEAVIPQLGWKSLVLLGEDVEWNRADQESLKRDFPKEVGIEVRDSIRYALDTTDFSPIFSRIMRTKADGIFPLLAITGARPISQWAETRVPMPMLGINVQNQDVEYYKNTNGRCESVAFWTPASDIARVTDRTIPFIEKYKSKNYPPPVIPLYPGFVAYDAVYILKDAIERAKSVKTETLVEALEKTDIIATQGRIQFYGKNDKYTHDIKFGKELVYAHYIQWQQNGRREVVWPEKVKTANLILPPWMR